MLKVTIHEALVGSRAHGLHTESSDYDWRGIHVVPTSEILSLNHKYSGTHWLEGDQDQTSYEIGHFLQLATKANPSVLEVLVADQLRVSSEYSQKLRELLPFMFDPENAFNAFAGYSCNQRKKLLEDHLGRKFKFGVAYIRTSYNLTTLFKTGTFSLVVPESLRQELLDVKAGKWSDGQIIDRAEGFIREAKEMLPNLKSQKDLAKINQFLLLVRHSFWDEASLTR